MEHARMNGNVHRRTSHMMMMVPDIKYKGGLLALALFSAIVSQVRQK